MIFGTFLLTQVNQHEMCQIFGVMLESSVSDWS